MTVQLGISPEDARECPLGALEERALDPERLELVVRRLGAAVVRTVVLEAVDAHPLARLADLGRDEVPLHRARVVLARRQRLHAAYLDEFDTSSGMLVQHFSLNN